MDRASSFAAPIFGAILLINAGPASAQKALPSAGAQPCKFHAFIVDKDGKTNVRSAPSTRAAVVGTLPAASKRLQSPNEGAQVVVIGTKDGFFLVEDANVDDIETADDMRKLGKWYRGRGWVHGSRLDFHIQSGDGLRATATAETPVSIRFPSGDGEPGVHVAAIHDCRAGNVEVTIHTLKDKPLGRGWIVPGATSGGSPPVTICAAQLTTCN
jgi:hypothetical protein